jgi:hypothetical protein
MSDDARGIPRLTPQDLKLIALIGSIYAAEAFLRRHGELVKRGRTEAALKRARRGQGKRPKA